MRREVDGGSPSTRCDEAPSSRRSRQVCYYAPLLQSVIAASIRTVKRESLPTCRRLSSSGWTTATNQPPKAPAEKPLGRHRGQTDRHDPSLNATASTATAAPTPAQRQRRDLCADSHTRERQREAAAAQSARRSGGVTVRRNRANARPCGCVRAARPFRMQPGAAQGSLAARADQVRPRAHGNRRGR